MEYIIYIYKNNIMIAPFDGSYPEYEEEKILRENVSALNKYKSIGLVININNSSIELVEGTWDGYQTYECNSPIEILKITKEFFSYIVCEE